VLDRHPRSLHTRSVSRLLAGLLALALAVDAALALAPAGARPRLGAYVQVTEVEYRLLLSEAVVRAGPVHLQQIDGGMDPHDLRLRYGRSAAFIAEPLLDPGQMHDAVLDLRPGVYHLWCGVPGHWKLGMHAILVVER
jgi:hypothetical protein